MSTPIRIAELQQIAERYRSGHGLDRDQEERAFAGLDALLDLARAAQDVVDDGVLCQTRPCDSCDALRTACAALDAAVSGGWYLTGEVRHCGYHTTRRISPQFTDSGGMSEGSARVAVAARNALPALLRLARAAARINELVGTETEEGQAEAWEELDAALAPFDFGDSEEARA